MKICYIADVNAVHTRRWACYFAQKGNQVDVISPGLESEQFAEEMRYAGITLHVLARTDRNRNVAPSQSQELSLGTSSSIGKLARLVYRCFPKTMGVFMDYFVVHNVRVRRILKSIQPDLVHGWYLLTGGLLAAVSGFRPLVISPWGADVLLDKGPKHSSWFTRFARAYSLRKADMITATCSFLAAETRKYAPRSREIKVVPFGVNCEQFHPCRRTKDTKTQEIILGFAKQLHPKYGPKYLVRAFDILSRRFSRLKLLIAGEGEMEAELRNLVAGLGLQDQVVFEGYVPHMKIPVFLGQVDIFVMPSVLHSEVFGVAAVEASAMEIPVVATRVGGVPEVVVDGVTGLLVEPRDEIALAKAIATLIENPSLRKRMGKAGREHVLRHYRWEENAAEMASLYEELLHDWRERKSGGN